GRGWSSCTEAHARRSAGRPRWRGRAASRDPAFGRPGPLGRREVVCAGGAARWPRILARLYTRGRRLNRRRVRWRPLRFAPAMATTNAPSADVADLKRRIAGNHDWYHTLELAPGVLTPGWVDVRPVVPRVPIPASLAGLRVLDVGTWDGFWAFEMERRGASE